MTTGWHWCSRMIAVYTMVTWVLGSSAGASAANDTPAAPTPIPQAAEEGVESRGLLPLQRQSQTLANPKLHQVTPNIQVGPAVAPICTTTVPPDIGGKPYVQPTHFLTLPPTAFSLGDNQYPDRYRISPSEIWAWRRDYNNASLPDISFIAPVFLPHGAVIRHIEILFLDDDRAHDLYFTLQESFPHPAGSYPPGDPRPRLTDRQLSISSNCIPSFFGGKFKPNGYGAYDTMQITELALPVNSQHAYSAKVNWTVFWHTPAITGESILFKWVRIGYTLQ